MQDLSARPQIIRGPLLARLVLVRVVVVDGAACGWQAEEISPEEGEDKVRGAEAVSLQERVQGPCSDHVRPADPGTGLLAKAVFPAKEERHGQEGQEDGLFVDLEREEVEGPGGGGEGIGEQVASRDCADEQGGWEDGSESDVES